MFQAPNQLMNSPVSILMFLLWAVLVAISLNFIIKGKLNNKYEILLYSVSAILGGLLLGGIPNAVMPIHVILITLGMNGPLLTIIPMIIVLSILLLTVLLLGRLFCGFACPVGALQELASKLKFKSSLKEQKEVQFKLDIPQNVANITRGIFFGIVLILGIFLAFPLLQIINPFLGFGWISPFVPFLLIPTILLGGIFLASIFTYRPWCRLFCPFGALGSIVGLVSRGKYERTEDCTDCGICEEICPTHQAVRGNNKSECYYCNRCVEACPSDAIQFKF
ncbi:MAG: putative Quinol dehydrogenase membrane component [Promethearchaeota archaeon]|nr:MAG: putative Quinol dehydrogenase membrane component [Candidatus Lokiarchaeota archaeon]